MMLTLPHHPEAPRHLGVKLVEMAEFGRLSLVQGSCNDEANTAGELPWLLSILLAIMPRDLWRSAEETTALLPST